jgi:phenylacetate-coenzyme A ligase PaaK-like adenylate-forming protein
MKETTTHGRAWDLSLVLALALVWGYVGLNRTGIGFLLVHASGALFQTFDNQAGSFRSIPSTLPLVQIVAALNEYRPDALQTYPSALRTLTHEARQGRLHMRPKYIMCGGEPLTSEVRANAEETFRVPIVDAYACSETSWIAVSFPCAGAPLHLVEDAAVYEPVDAQCRRVAPGTPGNGLLVTNVVNRLLPLIRYELTDGVTLLNETNPGPWTGRRIAPVHGRQEQVFTYAGGIEINPEVFDAALDRVPAVLESQVEQLDNGAILRLRVGTDANLRPLAEELRATLRSHGLFDAEIRIERFRDHLDGTAGTGKLNRFLAHEPGHISRIATS